MIAITKKIELKLSAEKAFEKFIYEFNNWWPKEYTWSNDTLDKISIAPKVGGFCTEIGPNGFRIDWGTVTDFQEKKCISFKWQIGPKREPIPNPKNASDIRIKFKDNGESETTLEFEHFNFDNHGDGGEDYKKMMNGKQGWDYILSRYQ